MQLKQSMGSMRQMRSQCMYDRERKHAALQALPRLLPDADTQLAAVEAYPQARLAK